MRAGNSQRRSIPTRRRPQPPSVAGHAALLVASETPRARSAAWPAGRRSRHAAELGSPRHERRWEQRVRSDRRTSRNRAVEGHSVSASTSVAPIASGGSCRVAATTRHARPGTAAQHAAPRGSSVREAHRAAGTGGLNRTDFEARLEPRPVASRRAPVRRCGSPSSHPVPTRMSLNLAMEVGRRREADRRKLAGHRRFGTGAVAHRAIEDVDAAGRSECASDLQPNRSAPGADRAQRALA